MEFPADKTGAFVAGKSAFMMPGKRNVAGETEVPALIPLQPAPQTISATMIARPGKFQFNLTRRL
jgi:hypothetical protein